MTVDEIRQPQEQFGVEQSAPALSGRMLLVSIGLPPFPAAVSFVIDNLSREFTPEELLIAGQWSSGSAAYQRAPSLPQFRYVDRDWTWPKRGRRYVHWMRWLLIPRMARRLSRLIREERCSAVMGVFPDERFLLAAYLAARRNKVPFYPYYHNTYRENREGLALRFATWLQMRTFAAAKVVFVMSEGMQRAWEERYPGVRFEPLVHTFSGDMPRFTPPPPFHQPLRLAFLGNLNESNLDAMGRFRQVANESPDCRLTIYSGSPQWFFEKVGICGPAIVHDKASDEELIDKLRSHDVLLLPHGFTGNFSRIEYETIFPTRTIPYLITGRPILAHLPSDCFVTRWLRRHDCAEIVDVPDVKQLARALDRLRSDEKRREQLVRNAVKAAEQFYAPTVAGGLRRILAQTMPAAQSKS